MFACILPKSIFFVLKSLCYYNISLINKLAMFSGVKIID
jgi:hypothetical protein